MNKIKRERFEIIRGTIVFSITSLVFYALIELIIMSLVSIISGELAEFLAQNIIFSVIFTFVSFFLSTLATIFLFFKNKDLEDEVGRDILKYVGIVLIVLSIAIAIYSSAHTLVLTNQAFQNAKENYFNENGIEFGVKYVFYSSSMYGAATLKKLLLFNAIKLLSRIITIFISVIWFGRNLVKDLLPEEA